MVLWGQQHYLFTDILLGVWASSISEEWFHSIEKFPVVCYAQLDGTEHIKLHLQVLAEGESALSNQ